MVDDMQKFIERQLKAAQKLQTSFEFERFPKFMKVLKRGLKDAKLSDDELSAFAIEISQNASQILQLNKIFRDDRVRMRASAKYAQQIKPIINLVRMGKTMGTIESSDAETTIKTLKSIYDFDVRLSSTVGRGISKGQIKTKSRFALYARLLHLLKAKNPDIKQTYLLTLFSELNNALLPEFPLKPDTFKTEISRLNKSRRK